MAWQECGVYLIRNVVTRKVYVGSSQYTSRRWRDHAGELVAGKHHSVKLQRAWDKYGFQSFEFEMAAYCLPSDLFHYEQVILDAFQAYEHGYNCTQKAGAGPRLWGNKHLLGHKHSDETKAKQRAASLGNTYARAGKGVLRGPQSEAHRANLSKSHTGSKHSEQHKQKIGDAQRGKPGTLHTDAAKLKMSLAKKGRKQSPEHVAKRAAAIRARKLQNQSELLTPFIEPPSR